MVEAWAWVLFILLIFGLIALDLGVLHRKRKVLTTVEALGWTLFWIALALLFNILLYFLYKYQWFGLGIVNGQPVDASQSALQFFTGFVVEKSLSLDNIFVIALIFEFYRIPVQYQHRVLLWGVLGALVLRGLMIAGGSILITQFSWMNYVFGSFLLYTAIKMLVTQEDTFDPESSSLVKLIRKWVPVSPNLDGEQFLTKINGKTAITPLMLVLMQVEATDVLFAVDSIPAIFAITSDTFIVFTSNIFAILGLRALYFALAAFMNRFIYLKVSLVFVLAFIAVKMLISHYYHIAPMVSLAVILGILSVGILPTLLSKEKKLDKPMGPPSSKLMELAWMTFRQAKRLVIIVTGFTVLLVGVSMIVLPGPAIIVIPLGLAVLARELVWAKRLLARFKKKGTEVINIFTKSKKE